MWTVKCRIWCAFFYFFFILSQRKRESSSVLWQMRRQLLLELVAILPRSRSTHVPNDGDMEGGSGYSGLREEHVVKASALLRLYCALMGIAGLRYVQENLGCLRTGFNVSVRLSGVNFEPMLEMAPPFAGLQTRRQSSSFSWWPADPQPLPLASALSLCLSVSCWPFPIWSGTRETPHLSYCVFILDTFDGRLHFWSHICMCRNLGSSLLCVVGTFPRSLSSTPEQEQLMVMWLSWMIKEEEYFER